MKFVKKVVSEGSLVSRSSYILFYKRKQSNLQNVKADIKQRERKEKRRPNNGHPNHNNGKKVFRSYQWDAKYKREGRRP